MFKKRYYLILLKSIYDWYGDTQWFSYQVDKMKNEATQLETEYLELQMQYIVKS